MIEMHGTSVSIAPDSIATGAMAATQATRAATLSGLPQTVPGAITGILGY
jgi:hypothetical protein